MKYINVSTAKHPNMFAVVDDEDFDRLNAYRWRVAFVGPKQKSVYAVRSVGTYSLGTRKTIWMHREVLSECGTCFVDHINGNGLDNRKSNLRPCTHRENQLNCRPNRSKRTSKYKGVWWNSSDRKFRATIRVAKGVLKQVGSFDNEVDAALAYNAAAILYQGEFAWLNKIEPTTETPQ